MRGEANQIVFAGVSERYSNHKTLYPEGQIGLLLHAICPAVAFLARLQG